MWSLVAAALAADPAPYGPVAAEVSAHLPLQVQDEDLWAARDLRATRTARAALVASGVSIAVTTAGIVTYGAVDFGDDQLQPLAAGLTAGGAIATAVTVPTFLGAVGRSHRSLRERNVFTGTGASAGAWTTLSLGAPASALFYYAPAGFPVWTGAILAMGCAQWARDDRARRAAGLPTGGPPWRFGLQVRPDGVQVDGTF